MWLRSLSAGNSLSACANKTREKSGFPEHFFFYENDQKHGKFFCRLAFKRLNEGLEGLGPAGV